MFDESQIRINRGLDSEFDTKEFESNFVWFNKESSYIVYLNNSIIGFYNIVEIKSDNIITIEYALVKKLRGMHMGQEFLNTIVDIVSKQYTDISKITLMIKYNNEASKKIATNEKFVIDFGLMERLSDEIDDYIPYCKSNEYYENKKLCLQK